MTDPRIHERRVQVARETGRRRRRWLLSSLGLVTVVVAAFALVHSPVFGARVVEVSGEAHVPHATIVRVAGLSGAPPLVDLSASAIARRVESLPWVKTATVDLAWPATVRIAVTARTPVATVRLGPRRFAVLDPTARVLEDVPSPPAGLPSVVPSVAVPRPGGRVGGDGPELASVAAATPETMVGEISAITSGREGIVLDLGRRLTVVLGNDSLLGDKFVALNTLLVRADLSGVAVIDLRVPSAPALLP